ncbi:serine-rich and transmembrane domain-containing protein 1 isoform X1 [Hippocampus comes]|uniref:serine-rich and transmembrane domain-containing protein 1 isoform X1 n=1 Tax=Hippocampus comes TaxID=109280 RepID=UPI00094F2F32|nr:PREDICTED: serine-rich and transmembrane domain-containing protein 1 isoform X1 [Hippocampus comes]
MPRMDQTGTSAVENGTFPHFPPTSVPGSSSGSAVASLSRAGGVSVYVWLFLGLLLFLLSLLVIALHRLKNIISSSSSCSSSCGEPRSTFTNVEICSVSSSRRSTVSSLCA